MRAWVKASDLGSGGKAGFRSETVRPATVSSDLGPDAPPLMTWTSEMIDVMASRARTNLVDGFMSSAARLCSSVIGDLNGFGVVARGGEVAQSFGVVADDIGGGQKIIDVEPAAPDNGSFDVLNLPGLFVFDLHITGAVNRSANVDVSMHIKNGV